MTSPYSTFSQAPHRVAWSSGGHKFGQCADLVVAEHGHRLVLNLPPVLQAYLTVASIMLLET